MIVHVETFARKKQVMRGLGDGPTAQTIIDGLRIYYNFIRKHQSLNGKTPAEASGLDLELGKNKWVILIEKASK